MANIINTANNAKVAEIIGTVGNIDEALRLMRWAVANESEVEGIDLGQVYDTDTMTAIKDASGDDVYYDDLKLVTIE